MKLKKRKIIAIIGPTASGKTAIAVKLAKKYDGEIVSADSRQVYCGLNLGTGKDLIEYGGIKHHLIDIKNPSEKFTLFDYLPLARAAVDDIFSRNKLPIIVGGTGLYVQAFCEGFHLVKKSNIKDKNYGVASRQTIYNRERLDGSTVEQLQEILKKIDSKVFDALSDKKNPHRLIRAIEKAQAGEVVTKTKPDFEVLQIGLEWPREILNDRIDRRVDDRFEQGMLEEVEDLLNSGVDAKWLIGLGLEYKIITQFLISNCSNYSLPRRQAGNQIPNIKSQIPNKSQIQNLKNSKEFKEMCELLKLRSHQYAKRQMTWFKRFPEIVWESNYKRIDDRAKAFLN